MRSMAFVFALVVAACASVEGARDRPPPFTGDVTEPGQIASDYPVGIDAPAGEYRLDPRHATVLFRIRHMGLAWVTARFDTKAATLMLDPADPSRSQLRASVDADSVNTGVLNADGERSFDQAVARALGEAQTPIIGFASTSIERTGQHTARVSGDLTMNGQTHPLALDVTFDGAAVDPLRGGATVLGFSAHGSFDRTQWGVGAWRAFTGDEVQIVIEAEFVKT
jgi:polyisoprenoid-binding protein YceI